MAMSSRVVPFQSLGYTWAASSTIPVDLSFLNPARSMRAPVVQGIKIRFSGLVNTGSSGGPARIFPQIYSQILLRDLAGDRVNLRGSSLRVIDHFEYGVSYSDCTPTTTIAATQTGATLEFYQRIPFRPLKCKRRSDFGMPLREFLDGGILQVVTGPALIATNFITTTSGTITIFVDMVDEGEPEAKSRVTWQDQNISRTEDQYNIGGVCRYALWYNGEVNERTTTAAPTAWSSQTLTSKTLEISQLQDTYLQDYYKQESRARIKDPGIPATASVVVTEDPMVTGQAIPILANDADEALPSLPQMATLHIKTSLSSVTTSDLPQVITSVVTERSDSATARTLGADFRKKLDRGVVIQADGNHRGIRSFHPAIQKFLPLKLG